MANFKIGSSKTVFFDPDFVETVTSDVWEPTDRDAVRLSKTDPNFNTAPLHLTQYLKNTLDLNVNSNREMFIGEVSNTTRVDNIPGATEGQVNKRFGLSAGSQFIHQYGATFVRRKLSSQNFNTISAFIGYPVSINFRFIGEGAFVEGGGSFGASILSWRDSDGLAMRRSEGTVNDKLSSNPFIISGWLGEANVNDRTIPIVDIDGNKLKLPNNILVGSGENVPNIDTSDVAGIYNLISSLPPWLSIDGSFLGGIGDFIIGGTDDENPEFVRYSVFQNAGNDTDQTGANFISELTLINNPERVDADGTIQPQTYPAGVTSGRITRTGTSALDADEPDYSKASFKATVISSVVEPEIIDEVSLSILQRSYHLLTVEVHDRGSAGLGSIPTSLATPRFPQFQIEGRLYYISSLEEGYGSELILTLTDRPGV